MGKITEVGDNNFDAEVLGCRSTGVGRFLGAVVRTL